MCISVFLKITDFFCFSPLVVCSGLGGTFGAVGGPGLRKDASAVIESTPDVCFYFAKRGSETISSMVPVPPFSVGYRCMPFGCGRRVYLPTSLHLMLGIGIDRSMP